MDNINSTKRAFNLDSLKSRIDIKPQKGTQYQVKENYETATGLKIKAGQKVTSQGKSFQHVTKTRSYGAVIVLTEKSTRKIIMPLYNLTAVTVEEVEHG